MSQNNSEILDVLPSRLVAKSRNLLRRPNSAYDLMGPCSSLAV